MPPARRDRNRIPHNLYSTVSKPPSTRNVPRLQRRSKYDQRAIREGGSVQLEPTDYIGNHFRRGRLDEISVGAEFMGSFEIGRLVGSC